MASKIGSLNVDLTLETARFNKGFQEAQGNMAKFQKNMQKVAGVIQTAFAGGVAVSAINSLRTMSKAAVDLAGNLGEEAAALGISTTALQEYRYAATQVNLSNEDMDNLFQQLTRRTGDAANGVKESADAFKRLGIDIRDSAGNVRNAADLMPEIASALAKIPSEAERAAITVDLFGRSGQKAAALLAGGAQGIDQYRMAAHELGIVLSEEEIANADKVADKIAALNYVIEAQQNKKLLENADALLEFEQSLGDLKLGLIDGTQTLQRWVDDFDAMNARNAKASGEFWKRVSNLAVSIPQALDELARKANEALKALVMGVQTWMRDKLNGIWDGVIAKVETVKAAFFDLWDKVTRRSYVPDMVDDIGRHMQRLDSLLVGKAKAVTKATTDLFRQMRDDLEPLMRDLFPEDAAMQDYLRNKARIDLGQSEGDLTDAKADEARARLLGRYREETPLPVPVIDVGLPMAALEGLQEKLREVAEATAPIGKMATEAMTQLQQAAHNAFSELGYQLEGVLLGVQSLGDALRNLVGTLAQMAMQTAWKGLGASIGIPGYANGTNFAPGGLSIVGERGPELVNLPRGSQVIPNHELKAMGGSGNTFHNSFSFPGITNAREAREAAGQVARRLRAELNAA